MKKLLSLIGMATGMKLKVKKEAVGYMENAYLILLIRILMVLPMRVK